MTKLELMTVMYSLDALMEEKDLDTAHRVIKQIMAEAERQSKK